MEPRWAKSWFQMFKLILHALSFSSNALINWRRNDSTSCLKVNGSHRKVSKATAEAAYNNFAVPVDDQCSSGLFVECETYRQIITRKQSLIPLTITPTPIVYEIYNCTNVVQLIVGGEQAKYGEFPHHALLGYPRETDSSQYDFRCGGTLISDRHVLTAAHCFSEGNPAVVRLGEYDTANVSDEEVQFGIARILKHPQYSNSRSYHDIALIRLDRQVWLTKYVRPACLWDSENRNITRYVATGFGYNETIGVELSTTMMKVQLDEFPVDDCARAFAGQKRFRNGVQAGQICVGSIVGGKDTCQGDSGGPLQVLANPKTCIYHVVGITSTGGACGVGHSKAIYTKISYYLDWIEDNVWGANVL